MYCFDTLHQQVLKGSTPKKSYLSPPVIFIINGKNKINNLRHCRSAMISKEPLLCILTLRVNSTESPETSVTK